MADPLVLEATRVVDSCSARAKRGGGLTGPNPTDRAKKGIRYHVAVSGDGLPVACAVTQAACASLVAPRLAWKFCKPPPKQPDLGRLTDASAGVSC